MDTILLVHDAGEEGDVLSRGEMGAYGDVVAILKKPIAVDRLLATVGALIRAASRCTRVRVRRRRPGT